MKTNKCECGFGYSGEWCQVAPVAEVGDALEAKLLSHHDTGNQSQALQPVSPHLAPLTASWIQAATGSQPSGNPGPLVPRTLQLAEEPMTVVTKRLEEPHPVSTAKLSPSPTLSEHEVLPSQVSALSPALMGLMNPKEAPLQTSEHEVMPTQLSALSPALLTTPREPPSQALQEDTQRASVKLVENTVASTRAIVDNEDAAPQGAMKEAVPAMTLQPMLADASSKSLLGLLSTAR